MVFENRVLRKTSGPNKDEVAGKCRTLQNEKLRTVSSSPNFIRAIKSFGMFGDRTGAYRNVVGKQQGKTTAWKT
jgi:hypothetical protein